MEISARQKIINTDTSLNENLRSLKSYENYNEDSLDYCSRSLNSEKGISYKLQKYHTKHEATVRENFNRNNCNLNNNKKFGANNNCHSFIKMAKYDKINSGNPLSRTGFSNRDIVSHETFSEKSSVDQSSLNKNVNLIQEYIIEPNKNYDRLNSFNNASYNTFNNCDKNLTYTNRSLANRCDYKPKLSERDSTQRNFSNNKLNFSSPTRQEELSMRSGDRLYQRGMATLERSSNNLKVIKEKKHQTEMKECTFKPKLLNSPLYFNINIINKNNIIFKGKNGSNYNNYEENVNIDGNYNINFNRRHQKNKSVKLQSRTFNSIKNFAITKSARLKSADQSRLKRTEEHLIRLGCRLHNHAEKSKINKEVIAEKYFNEKYPFHPKLLIINSRPDIFNFFNRLQGWVDKRNQKYQQDMEIMKYDDKTGLRLFSPEINKNKLVNEELVLNENSRNKFKKLYDEWRNREERGISNRKQREQELNILSSISHMNTKSKEILDVFINKMFSKIFDVIADPSTKLVNGMCIDSEELPDKIKEVLLPLTTELKELKETLDFNEFLDACTHLYKLLSVDHKNLLIEWYFLNTKKNRDKSKEKFGFTYKPVVNKNSIKIFETSKSGENGSFHERCNKFLKNKEDKVNVELEQKNMKEMLNFTFKPNLISKQKEPKEVSKFYDHIYEKYKQRIFIESNK